MPLNIVLIEPEIPNNTGNIGRLALATGSRLHLVKPFGFEIDDKRLKRAGLDYWQHLEVIYYDSIEEFFEKSRTVRENTWQQSSQLDFSSLCVLRSQNWHFQNRCCTGCEKSQRGCQHRLQSISAFGKT